MDASLAERLASALDRREIEELVKLYFAASDRRQPALMEQVFGDDGKLWIGGQLVRGPGAVPGGPPLAAVGVPSPPIAASHCMQQCVIELDGDTARGEVYAIVYLVLEGEPRKVMVRGVRYLDRYVRRAVGWRIAERRHCADWAFEQPANFAVEWAERGRFDDLAPLG